MELSHRRVAKEDLENSASAASDSSVADQGASGAAAAAAAPSSSAAAPARVTLDAVAGPTPQAAVPKFQPPLRRDAPLASRLGPDVLFEVRNMDTFSHITIGYVLPEMLEGYVVQVTDMTHMMTQTVDVGLTCMFHTTGRYPRETARRRELIIF